MSNDTVSMKSSLSESSNETRPCAFYQVDMLVSAQPAPGGTQVALDGTSTLRHRCMLHPGKSNGPDGNSLGASECTLARQALCQAQRRQVFTRLHATLATVKRPELAQASVV